MVGSSIGFGKIEDIIVANGEMKIYLNYCPFSILKLAYILYS